MKKYFIALILCFVFYDSSKSQKIIYSQPQKDLFTDVATDVICKRNGKILIYAAFYNSLLSPVVTNTYKASGASATKIADGKILIYDDKMNMVTEKSILPEYDNVSGVHFVVLHDSFIMFYHYQRGHTVYFMVAKFDFDANLIGRPIQLDSKSGLSKDFPIQLFSVCYSENKNHYVVYSLSNDRKKTSVLDHLHFDRDFNLIKKYSTKINVRFAKELLNGFCIDDEGNFLFLRTTKVYNTEYAKRTSLIILPVNTDTLIFRGILSQNIVADEFHIKIDNRNHHYILASFFSNKASENVEGIYTVIIKASHNNDIVATQTLFDKTFRERINANGTPKKAMNNFFIQNINLKYDGGFLIDAANLYQLPDRSLRNRWNFVQYPSLQIVKNYSIFVSQILQNYSLDNQYDPNYYYPWHQWKFYESTSISYNSQNLMVLNFNADGNEQWIKTINTSQRDRFVNSIGYIIDKTNDGLYFLFNENIKNKVFITAQSINDKGEINVAGNLKEDKMISESNVEYTLLPRLGKQVSEKEVVIPCLAGDYICFAKIELQ